ncbi:MAG: hypothetical protein ACOVS5_07425 [Oligoflexus sp.]|jgi:hypothetical protein
MRTLFQLLAQKARAKDWLPLLDYFSPLVFEILPARELLKVVSQLLADRSKAEVERPLLAERIRTWGLPLSLDESLSPLVLGEAQRGSMLLELYFAQIFRADETWLDLRHKVFVSSGSGWVWQPQPLRWCWSSDFIEAMRAVYRGFYWEDEALYLQGLRSLELSHAAELFRRHFGSGDQSAVPFSIKEFRGVFHQIFVSCKEARNRLHPEFLPFGLYLATLYEHLDTAGGLHDVRSAVFKHAAKN